MKYTTVEDILEGIREASTSTFYNYLDALRERFKELFPGWEMCIHNLNTNEDIETQIDKDIAFMEALKNFNPVIVPKPEPPVEEKKVHLRLLQSTKNTP